jgi:hemolysin III
MFQKFRDPVSGLMHLVAAVAAVVGSAGLLYLGRNDGAKEAALAVYGSSLVLMFSASAAYHSIRSGRRITRWLHRLDHASIYLLVAGTYTPICLHFFTGIWRWGLLGTVWCMGFIGIGLKLFAAKVPRWLTASISLLMGWLSLLAIPEVFRTMRVGTMGVGAIVWLVLGGLFFSVGAVVYITKRPNYFPRVFGFHEIWHIFVILGCLSHYIVIAVYVAPAA